MESFPSTWGQAHSIFFCFLILCPWKSSIFTLTWTKSLAWEVKICCWIQVWNSQGPRLPKGFDMQNSICIQCKYELILCGFKRTAHHLPQAQLPHWSRGSTGLWRETSSVADFNIIPNTRNFKDRLLCFDNHLAALRSGTKLPRILVCANYALLLWNVLAHDLAWCMTGMLHPSAGLPL